MLKCSTMKRRTFLVSATVASGMTHFEKQAEATRLNPLGARILAQLGCGVLEAKVVTAKLVVDRLVSIAAGYESGQWIQRYQTAQTSLAEGWLNDAIRDEVRASCLGDPAEWVVSRDLAATFSDAMTVVARQLRYPEKCEPVLELDELPDDVTASGTVAEENERKLQASRRRLQALRKIAEQHRVDEDDEFAAIANAASDLALRGTPALGDF